MRIQIEDCIHDAEVGIAGGADVVIIAYPDHLFALERERPYTHIYCRDQAAVNAVRGLLPEARITGDDDNLIVLYYNGHASDVISALYPLFTHTRADDLPLIEAFGALDTGEPLEFIGVIHIPAIDRRMADAWMARHAGFMEEVEALTTELTQRYLHSGSIRDAISGMGYNADAILDQVNGLLGIDAEAMLTKAADYTQEPAADPTKRPHFGPDQVRSYTELKYGHFYVLVTGLEGHCQYIRFKRIEWWTDGPVMVYESAERASAGWGEQRVYLGDSGLAPYEDGSYQFWNTTNHVLRAPRKSRYVYVRENGKIVKRQRRFWR